MPLTLIHIRAYESPIFSTYQSLAPLGFAGLPSVSTTLTGTGGRTHVYDFPGGSNKISH